jgi:DNA-binding transcriptional LysR family regulator
MQDLNDMLYFAEVVEKGGFAAAGRALGLPKSKLSRRLAELESRLGIRLLQRTTRKLSVTQAGELYLRHCIDMRDAAVAAADAVALVQTEPRGTIRVTCPITLAHSSVGHAVPQFMQRYPGVKVDMRVTNRVIDLVEEGIDVALRVRTTLDESGSLVSAWVKRVPCWWPAPRSWSTREGQRPSMNWVVWTPSPCPQPTGAAAGGCSARRARNTSWPIGRAMWPMT